MAATDNPSASAAFNPLVHHLDASIGSKISFEADLNGRTRHGHIVAFTSTGYVVDLVGRVPQTIEVDADDESVRVSPVRTPRVPAVPPRVEPIAEPSIRYFLMEVRGTSHALRDWDPFPTPVSAIEAADTYNAEERELAAMEQRPVRTVFEVVRAITTYERYTSEAATS